MIFNRFLTASKYCGSFFCIDSVIGIELLSNSTALVRFKGNCFDKKKISYVRTFRKYDSAWGKLNLFIQIYIMIAYRYFFSCLKLSEGHNNICKYWKLQSSRSIFEFIVSLVFYSFLLIWNKIFLKATAKRFVASFDTF